MQFKKFLEKEKEKYLNKGIGFSIVNTSRGYEGQIRSKPAGELHIYLLYKYFKLSEIQAEAKPREGGGDVMNP